MRKPHSKQSPRAPRASKANRPVVLVASGGDVFVGKRLDGAYVWIDAETLYPEEAANQAVFDHTEQH